MLGCRMGGGLVNHCGREMLGGASFISPACPFGPRGARLPFGVWYPLPPPPEGNARQLHILGMIVGKGAGNPVPPAVGAVSSAALVAAGWAGAGVMTGSRVLGSGGLPGGILAPGGGDLDQEVVDRILRYGRPLMALRVTIHGRCGILVGRGWWVGRPGAALPLAL